MKKFTSRLALVTHTIRPLQANLAAIGGGTQATGTSILPGLTILDNPLASIQSVAGGSVRTR
jgi:hypothetical protein